MEYTKEILITLGILIIIVAALLLGWRNMHRRHRNFPVPKTIPENLSEPLTQIEGIYVATTAGEDWLARIHAHGLGNRSNAMVVVYPEGVGFWREGEDNYFIPKSDLRAVGYTSGQTGKFVEKDGLVMVTWNIGQEQTQTVQTGFRTRYTAEKKVLREAIEHLTNTTTKENNA